MKAITAESRETPGSAGHQARQTYLIFRLEQHQLGLPVLAVREIIGLQDITPVPQAPSFVRGVINLRGKVIPVVDLRQKFGLPLAESNARSCIVVVQHEASGAPMLVGLLVDGVSEVAKLTGSEIEEPPQLSHDVDTSCILGLAKTKDGIKVLLDIDRVLGKDLLGDEWRALSSLEAGRAE